MFNGYCIYKKPSKKKATRTVFYSYENARNCARKMVRNILKKKGHDRYFYRTPDGSNVSIGSFFKIKRVPDLDSDVYCSIGK